MHGKPINLNEDNLMFKTAVYYSLEKMINLVLSRDMDSRRRLARLEDKVVAIEITDLNLGFYWLFENYQVRLLSSWRTMVDASIASPLNAMMQLGLSKAKVAKGLTITGDMHVVEAFKELFAKLDIDWEAQLVPFTGEIIAFKTAQSVRAAGGWLTTAAVSMRENAKEYLEGESQLLPSRLRFEDFVSDIRQLNRDLDRLTARLKQWQLRGSK